MGYKKKCVPVANLLENEDHYAYTLSLRAYFFSKRNLMTLGCLYRMKFAPELHFSRMDLLFGSSLFYCGTQRKYNPSITE